GKPVGVSRACHVVRDVQDAIRNECVEMLEEIDRVNCAIGEHGLKLLDEIASRTSQTVDPINILTHCNAGVLAGTGALSPIYLGMEQGRKFHVFADETRPLLQGSRITAFELKENGVPVTIICDSMAAAVLSRGNVDACIVGADR